MFCIFVLALLCLVFLYWNNFADKIGKRTCSYGGVSPTADAEPDEIDEHQEEDTEQVKYIAGIFFKSTAA